MLFSRIALTNEFMNAVLQDTQYTQEPDHEPDNDCANSADVSFENFYDAPQENVPLSLLPECRISLDPTDRLIDAIDSLREVISENTNAQNRLRRHKGPTTPGNKPITGTGGLLKSDERLKVRKEKVGPGYSDSDDSSKEKVIVELRVVFLKIGEIDTLKEQYNADVFIQAKWREPKLDGKSTEELKIIELEKYWNPLLYIDNIITETKDSCWLTATPNSRGEAYVMERRRIKGIFLENLELNDFPLDVQDLTLTMTTERPDTEIDIIPDENEMSGINVQTFVDQQVSVHEWRLHEHIEVTRRVMTQEFSSSSRNHPALSVTCRAARRPGYFYWNVFLVMFLISGLSFATFAVAPTLPQKRLVLAFTLLLTSVTFKYVINQSLPKISYLTYMDKYVLMSLVILCIVCIWHAIVTLFIGKMDGRTDIVTPTVAKLERDVFISFAVMYIVCHIFFIFWLYFDACKRRRLMKTKDREFRTTSTNLDFLAKRKEWQEKSKELSLRRTSTVPLHATHAAIYDRS
ncbi:gamma-aminobutyric acid receptor subunit gamma-3-like isoform X3 [Lineus longissimus]|uniref:gamma-aminobutyric acid receptor subunit gamma-3-like isoform X3 n=1 Tax=Lineus longissimus TaxID=88925 RepID=UPI00315DF69D